MSIERIRAALAAGPTPGPWSVETVPTSCGVCHKVGPFPGRRPGDPPRHACLYADYPSQGNPADDELEANAAFIAACNPAAIHDLLAHIDAQAAEIERLRADVERLVAALQEAIGLRVKLYRQSDCDGETDALTDRQVGECDDFVKQWLATIDAARSKEQK